jgi:uncharacterized protein (TIGR03083 family)
MTESHTPIDVRDIPRIGHREAMAITAVENALLGAALTELDDTDWQLPTDCTGWDVRALVVHLVASAQAQASPLEFARQVRAGRPLTAQIGGVHWVDGLNEAQLRARTHLKATELPSLWTTASAAALTARRRMPAPLRALPLLPLGEGLGTHMGWKPLGYLFDIGFTRDVWMHRVDLARATDRPMAVTSGHDGRMIADIAAEWATLHTESFTLYLTGAAGGTYTRGTTTGGEVVEFDAIEFCRLLSGRKPRPVNGVLRHALPL